VNEGGTVTTAGRDGSSIVLQGIGSGLSGAGGRAVLSHQYDGAAAITARIVSLEGAGGTGEAGIRIEVQGPAHAGMDDIGLRLFYRADGTLRWESRIFSFPVEPGLPVGGLSLPLWLRIQWVGEMQGMYSKDGVNWTKVTAPLPLTLPPWALPGLLVSSQGNAAPASARFDNVWISGGDADDNGIKDGWEMKYFGRLTGAAASEDPDGDGTVNIEEWMWGLNPNRPDLKPPLQRETLANGSLRLSLSSSSNSFEIEAATTPQGPWQVLTPDIPVPPSYWRTATVPADAPRRFFRATLTRGPYSDPLPRDLP
jgi:hypothetical protein